MKRIKSILPALAIAATVLAACNMPVRGINSVNLPNSGTQPATSVAAYGTSVVPWLQAAHETASPQAITTGPVPVTGGQGSPTTPPAVTHTPIPTDTVAATISPLASQPISPANPSTLAPNPLPSFTPIVPNTGSGTGQISSVAALIGYRVVDRTGADIGQVRDYIANLCEGHLLYAVVRLAPSLKVPSNLNLLVPYEAFIGNTNNGRVDTGQDVLTLDTTISGLNGAPLVDLNTLDLQNPGWDASVQNYWRQNFSLALTAGCKIAGDGVVITETPSGPGATARPATATASPVVQSTSVPTDTLVPPTDTPLPPQPTNPPPPPPTSPPPAPTNTPAPADSGPTIIPPGQAKPPHSKPTKKPKGSAAFFLADYSVSADQAVTGSSTAMPNSAIRIVYRIALVSHLIGAPVQDLRGNNVAIVRDIGILPHTGGLLYYVVAPSGVQNRLVAVPISGVNIKYVTNSGKEQPLLYFLIPVNALNFAPAYDASTGNAPAAWSAFWRRYVPNP